MIVNIDKSEIIGVLKHLKAIVPPDDRILILTTVMIVADKDKNEVKLTVTDLDTTAVASINAQVTESGSVVVPIKNLFNVLRKIPNGLVEISENTDMIKIKPKDNVNTECSLCCYDVSQFPLIPQKDLSQAMAVNAQLFLQMIEKTMFAVSTDDNRPILKGVYWQVLSNEHVMAATDGKKIAEMKTFGNMPVEEAVEQVLPVNGLNFLQRTISDDINEIKVLLEPNRVTFSYGRFMLFSHVIEGRYPDYRSLFVELPGNGLMVWRNVLIEAIRSASVFSPKDTSRIRFDLSSEKFEVTTFDRDMGEVREVINDYEYTGQPVSIAFNYKYLQSILNVIDSDKARILFGNSEDPVIIFNDVDPENTAARYLLMPLRYI